MLWFVIGLAVLLSLLSLRGERSREQYYRRMLTAAPPSGLPRVTVIVPVKGHDEGLAANLRSLAELDYPDYELIVVSKDGGNLPEGVVPPKARVVFAGDPPESTGEKIGNLLAAIRAARPESTVLAFADSDGRVPRGWLTALVSALAEPDAGAVTGYRWHLPGQGGLWPLLRSVWNSVIAGGMGPGRNNFVWGGAMAIQRDTFEKLDIPAWWRGAISDDYRLSEAVKAAGLRIAFAPGAMVASTDTTTARECLEWIRRQMMITRYYSLGLWRLALFAHLIYCTAMVAALRYALLGSIMAWACLLLPLAIGTAKGWNRLRLARMAMPEHDAWFDRYSVIHALLVPAGTWLWLYACVASAFSGEIVWRGYRIRLRRLSRPQVT